MFEREESAYWTCVLSEFVSGSNSSRCIRQKSRLWRLRLLSVAFTILSATPRFWKRVLQPLQLSSDALEQAEELLAPLPSDLTEKKPVKNRETTDFPVGYPTWPTSSFLPDYCFPPI